MARWFRGKALPFTSCRTRFIMARVSLKEFVAYATPNGRCIFRLDAHIKRFFNSAKLYRYPRSHLPFPKSKQDAGIPSLKMILRQPTFARWHFLAPVRSASSPNEDVPTEVIIAAMEFGTYLGEEGLKNGIDVCVSSWARTTSAALPVLSKAGGHYLNAQLIGGEARRNGFAEGISVTARGTVSEGSAENLFIVRDGKIFTPPLSAAILDGITRDAVITLARHLDFDVIEQEIPRELLYIADEIFLTGTAAEVTPVRSVDRMEIGCGSRGPITEALQNAFFGLFDGTTQDQWNWLDSVES